ncbi:MAG: MBL fold metallo-hydrolase [Clostridia bacterium]|nr:MBL fold metallo-hydrolase [Clostridia bacterium]
MRKRVICIFAMTLLTIGLLFLFSCNKENTTSACIDILKIGKADCIVINTGTKIVMIDTGEEENFDDISFYMSKKGYDKIDCLILTHYDKDHIGGADKVISAYQVTNVIENAQSDTSIEYMNYHNNLYSKDQTPLKLNQDYTFTYDSCEFTINVPKQNRYEIKNDNNSSLVVSMKCGDKRFLFCGDAMELRVDELIQERIGQYDFVKLPHHGSYLESYEDFLKMTKPTYSVITDSKKNPADEQTLNILSEHNVLVYETRYGTVTITTNGTEITIKQ